MILCQLQNLLLLLENRKCCQQQYFDFLLKLMVDFDRQWYADRFKIAAHSKKNPHYVEPESWLKNIKESLNVEKILLFGGSWCEKQHWAPGLTNERCLVSGVQSAAVSARPRQEYLIWIQ